MAGTFETKVLQEQEECMLAIVKVGLTMLSHIVHEDPPSETYVRRMESSMVSMGALFLDAVFHCSSLLVQIELRLCSRW